MPPSAARAGPEQGPEQGRPPPGDRNWRPWLLWGLALTLALILPFVITSATKKSGPSARAPAVTSSTSSGAAATSSAAVLGTTATTPPQTEPAALVSTHNASVPTHNAPAASTEVKPPSAPAAPAPAAAAAAAPTEHVVTVAPGDTMWSLTASRLGPAATAAQIVAAWPTFYAQNKAVIGSDPGLLRPGEVLHVTV